MDGWNMDGWKMDEWKMDGWMSGKWMDGWKMDGIWMVGIWMDVKWMDGWMLFIQKSIKNRYLEAIKKNHLGVRPSRLKPFLTTYPVYIL